LTNVLSVAGANWPIGKEGPRHKALITGFVIESHLAERFSASDRGRLIHHVNRLYKLRLMADYQPSIDVGEFDAKEGLAHMQRLEEILGKSG
jgi:hypothetical protein